MILDWVWLIRKQISVRPKNREQLKIVGLLGRDGRSTVTRPPAQRAPNPHRLPVAASIDRVPVNAAQRRVLEKRKKANFLGSGDAGDDAVGVAASPGPQPGPQHPGPQPLLRLQRPATNGTTLPVPNRTRPSISPRRLSQTLEKKPRTHSKAIGMLLLVGGGMGPGTREHGLKEHGPRDQRTVPMPPAQIPTAPIPPVRLQTVPTSPVRSTASMMDRESLKKYLSWSAGESKSPQVPTKTAKTMPANKPSATKTFRPGKRPFRTCCIPIRCRSNPGQLARHPRAEPVRPTNLVKPVTWAVKGTEAETAERTTAKLR